VWVQFSANFLTPASKQQNAKDVSEEHMMKSNPYTVMVSTPNAPESLFECSEKESEPNQCLIEKKEQLHIAYQL
jgi:hypothetical protein